VSAAGIKMADCEEQQHQEPKQELQEEQEAEEDRDAADVMDCLSQHVIGMDADRVRSVLDQLGTGQSRSQLIQVSQRRHRQRITLLTSIARVDLRPPSAFYFLFLEEREKRLASRIPHPEPTFHLTAILFSLWASSRTGGLRNDRDIRH